jgi:hypothetical protein
MGPIDYSIDVKSPFETYITGLQAGFANRTAQDQETMRGIAMQQQQQLAQAQKQQASAIADFAAKQNKTAEEYANFALQNPGMAEAAKKSWEILSPAQQQSRISQASQMMSALRSGRADIAAKLADDHAAALQNSGNEQEAKQLQDLSKLITNVPSAAMDSIAMTMAGALGPEAFAKSYESVLTSPVAAAKASADISNIDSQISDRAARLGLDRDKLTTETQTKLYELQQKANPAMNLDGDAKKLINESAIASTSASQLSERANKLAGDFAKIESFAGTLGGWGESYKRMTGDQNAVSSLKQEYVRIRAGEIGRIAKSQGGAFTDNDMKIALQSFPDENADPQYMASYMRGMAKLQLVQATTEAAKSEWVNSVGHLGKSRSDISIDGVSVPAGTTFNDFASKFVADKANKLSVQQQQAPASIANRSYAKFMQPQGEMSPQGETQ